MVKIHIATEEETRLVFSLRHEVFVDEQQVSPEIELDVEDAHALHIIAEEDGLAVGCARVILSAQEAHIGRLAVKKAYRSCGVGSAVCRFIIDDCRQRGVRRIWLNAQLRVAGFYERLGFRPRGEIFTEAGMEHIQMVMDEESQIR